MRVGVRRRLPARACSRITAGNYGGKLGPFHLRLHKLLSDIQDAAGG